MDDSDNAQFPVLPAGVVRGEHTEIAEDPPLPAGRQEKRQGQGQEEEKEEERGRTEGRCDPNSVR